MEMSSVATAKVSEDRELLNELKQASPTSHINAVGLFFDEAKGPIESLADRVRAASKDGKTKLEGIPELKIVTYLELAGMTVVSGSAEAIAKALELDCVRGATKGDRPIFRGAIRE